MPTLALPLGRRVNPVTRCGLCQSSTVYGIPSFCLPLFAAAVLVRLQSRSILSRGVDHARGPLTACSASACHSLQPLFSSSGRPISAKRHWDDFALDSDEEDDFDWADEGGSADQPSLPVTSALQETPLGIGRQTLSTLCAVWCPPLTALAPERVCPFRALHLTAARHWTACDACGDVCLAGGAQFQPYAKRRRSGAVSFRTPSGTLENGAPCLPQLMSAAWRGVLMHGHSVDTRREAQVAPQVSGRDA